MNSTLTPAAFDVLAERQRQIDAEGWTPEHDDEHDLGQMALAGACYAAHAGADAALSGYRKDLPTLILHQAQEFVWWGWPWARQWWKPKTQRHNLVRAAALIIAEIERIDRAAAKNPQA